jgi:hypothetical protein
MVLTGVISVPPCLPSSQATRAPDPSIVHGITLSTHGGGQDWGSDDVASTMEDLREVGANWVATHPYASIAADGEVRFHAFDPTAPPAYLVRPIHEAHAKGMKILIKPHLACWGSPFDWRGDIAFETPQQWDRFWSTYREWILQLVRACHEADAFVVGTELDRTLDHPDQWRSLIASVRQLTDRPLTYAANWTDFQRVGFWDALDVIGIQAYFPLSTAQAPTREDLDAGWARIMGEVSAYATACNRRVVFTELGYNRSLRAAAEPWAYQLDGSEAEALQAECLRSALAAIDREPAVVGAFLWKWFPRPRSVGRNFQLATVAMSQVIRDAWR